MQNLDKGVEKLVQELKEKEAAQDELLKITRESVRDCSVAIKYLHENKIKEADERIASAKKAIGQLEKFIEDFHNSVEHAQQEYAEAVFLKALIQKKPLPAVEDLNLSWISYLNGLMDCVGELRRELLESLRKGKRKDAEYYFEQMESIFESLLPLKFSNSLLPGFRAKQDVARRQVEQARSELVTSR